MRDRTFVIFNTGLARINEKEKRLIFDYVHGWLLSETEREIKLLGADLLRKEYNRSRELPKNWETYAHKHPKDRPLLFLAGVGLCSQFPGVKDNGSANILGEFPGESLGGR